MTSLVVPDRQSTTTRAYRRPNGISEAANASVSPCPLCSLAAAYDCAMNHEVPQPTTATRSPGAGSSPATSLASPAALRQQAGCEAISCSVRTPATACFCVTEASLLITELISSGMRVSPVPVAAVRSRSGEPGGGHRPDEVALRDEEDREHGHQAHHVGRHEQVPFRRVRSLEGGQAKWQR